MIVRDTGIIWRLIEVQSRFIVDAAVWVEHLKLDDAFTEVEKVASVSSELQSIFRLSIPPYMIFWLAYYSKKEVEVFKIPILNLGAQQTPKCRNPMQKACKQWIRNRNYWLLTGWTMWWKQFRKKARIKCIQ